MKIGTKLALGIGLAVTIGSIVFLMSYGGEPTYGGRRISAWLDDVTLAASDGKKFHAAAEAIGHIGTNAFPFIIRRLEEDDSIRVSKYRELWWGLPASMRRMLPRPKQPLFNSANGILAWCGPDAVPQVLQALQHTNPVVREVAACSLVSLRHVTPAASQAVPGLIEALSDNRPALRVQAARALGNLGPEASSAVPTLTSLVQKNPFGPASTHTCVVALGRIGTNAQGAVPALKSLLQNPEPMLRGEAAVAIWRITADAETTLPVVLEALAQLQGNAKRNLLEALGEMGPRARSALPSIAKELNDSTGLIREAATNAFKRIAL